MKGRIDEVLGKGEWEFWCSERLRDATVTIQFERGLHTEAVGTATKWPKDAKQRGAAIVKNSERRKAKQDTEDARK